MAKKNLKLIIQIPCYNEEKTLPVTYADLPKQIPGIDKVEVLISDDGSTDKTIEVAREIGVDHIVSKGANAGLASNFKTAIDESLRLGADIIVNTDGDNQYNGADIAKLVAPIVNGEAEIVVGERPIEENPDFSFLKKRLQKLGSWVVRLVSDTNVPDAPSGFRAYSREAALKLNVVTHFSYTLETIIQAGQSGTKITSVSIRTNRKTRESRLFKGMIDYLKRSGSTIIRMFAFYKPLGFFLVLGSMFTGFGALLWGRAVISVLLLKFGPFARYLPSIIVGGIFVVIGVIVYVIGFLADVINHNRKLNEEILYRLRKIEYESVKCKV